MLLWSHLLMQVCFSRALCTISTIPSYNHNSSKYPTSTSTYYWAAKSGVLLVSDDVAPKEGRDLHNNLLILHSSTILDIERRNLPSLRSLHSVEPSVYHGQSCAGSGKEQTSGAEGSCCAK